MNFSNDFFKTKISKMLLVYIEKDVNFRIKHA